MVKKKVSTYSSTVSTVLKLPTTAGLVSTKATSRLMTMATITEISNTLPAFVSELNTMSYRRGLSFKSKMSFSMVQR